MTAAAPRSPEDTLLERLQKADISRADTTAHTGPYTIFGEAAAAITALKSSLEQAEQERNEWKQRHDDVAAIQHEALTAEREKAAQERSAKDGAYEERNKVVALLARLFPSGTARTAIEGWSEDWHGCVYINLPSGQVSWHFHDSHAYLFSGLPAYKSTWDGHDTPEKYRRVLEVADVIDAAMQEKPHG